MLNVVFQRMEAGSATVVVPPIVVSDLLGLPPADASNMSAFVQQFGVKPTSLDDAARIMAAWMERAWFAPARVAA